MNKSWSSQTVVLRTPDRNKQHASNADTRRLLGLAPVPDEKGCGAPNRCLPHLSVRDGATAGSQLPKAAKR
ncbi:hypothetical protein BC834DRAFT_38794 [Gloeopeniophorella convolvens]|nr:hypothetical protein BC834DRAFT_38794 [Gloeopeniophorella convolvens]